jgi:pyruvate kinase
MAYAYRHTKVVFTIGPATAEEDVLRQLVETGVDICRLNMAHAAHDWTVKVLGTLRKVCQEVGRHVSVMMDVKGPEIRTGDLPAPVVLKKGDRVDFFADPAAMPERDGEGRVAGAYAVGVNYPGFARDVRVGATVLVDSGLIRMKILEIEGSRVSCEVLIPGPLGNRRHINLPGVHVKLPALTDKDRRDIRLGIENHVEYFALSFVRQADDLDILRRHLGDFGSEARIIAKIEDQSAITNLDEIIKASDGLMVARGDLGIEIPFEDLPLVQRRAVRTCRHYGKPVIVATHMLESMIENPIPTRAEITDVANAVFEQADAVMLSGETSVGKYPIECVDVLNRIIGKVESEHDAPPFNEAMPLRTPKAKMLRSAVSLAAELDGTGIVVFTRSGFLAQILSSLRPRLSPIYAFTDADHVFKQMLLFWGIEPFRMDFHDDPEETIRAALEILKTKGWLKSEEPIVVITNVLAGRRIVDSIQFRKVE